MTPSDVRLDEDVLEALSSMERELFEAGRLDAFVRPVALGEMPISDEQAQRSVMVVTRLGHGARCRQLHHGEVAESVRSAFEAQLARRVALLRSAARSRATRRPS